MRKFIAPPYFENGNPLNAYGVNQIIESVNALESEFMDFKMLRPKMLIKGQLKGLDSLGNDKNGFIFLKTFSHLRIAGIASSGLITLNLRRVGKSDVPILSIPSSNFDGTVHLNDLQDPPNAGELYVIYLTSTSDTDVTINYFYEFNLTPITKISMSTIDQNSVITKSYLNNFVNNIRQLPDLAPSNPPFRGVGGRVAWPTSNVNYFNQFAKWEGVRLNNFLRIRFRTKRDVSETLSVNFYITASNNQYSIGDFSAPQNVFNKYNYVLNFSTKSWTINNAVTGEEVRTGISEDGVQNISKGTFYEFKATSETNTTSNKIFIDYVLESKNSI